jgi:hypothetical protein
MAFLQTECRLSSELIRGCVASAVDAEAVSAETRNGAVGDRVIISMLEVGRSEFEAGRP